MSCIYSQHHATGCLIILIVTAIRYIPALHDSLAKSGSPLPIVDHKMMMMILCGLVAVRDGDGDDAYHARRSISILSSASHLDYQLHVPKKRRMACRVWGSAASSCTYRSGGGDDD